MTHYELQSGCTNYVFLILKCLKRNKFFSYEFIMKFRVNQTKCWKKKFTFFVIAILQSKRIPLKKKLVLYKELKSPTCTESVDNRLQTWKKGVTEHSRGFLKAYFDICPPRIHSLGNLPPFLFPPSMPGGTYVVLQIEGYKCDTFYN